MAIIALSHHQLSISMLTRLGPAVLLVASVALAPTPIWKRPERTEGEEEEGEGGRRTGHLGMTHLQERVVCPQQLHRPTILLQLSLYPAVITSLQQVSTSTISETPYILSYITGGGGGFKPSGLSAFDPFGMAGLDAFKVGKYGVQ